MADWSRFFDIPGSPNLWEILNSTGVNTLALGAITLITGIVGGKVATRVGNLVQEIRDNTAAPEVRESEKRAKVLEQQQVDATVAPTEPPPPEPPSPPEPPPPPPQAPPPAQHAQEAEAKNYRLEAGKLVEKAKEELDKRAENDPDGRHRRTYEAIPRYDYVVLAVALNERGQISDDELKAAARLFAAWKPFSRGRAASIPVPESVYQTIAVAETQLKLP